MPGYPLAPEGKTIILSSIAVFLVFVVLSAVFGCVALILACGLLFIWVLLVLHFFRDPDRHTPQQDRTVISPADGKVISIGVSSSDPVNPPGVRLSIFMSPLNVHVNRAPVEGTIRKVEHKNGRFLSAFKPEAERENERTIVHLDTIWGIIAFSQVAGFLARRIVFHPKQGDHVLTGQRIGMIRFGSRVDVYLPKTFDFKVGVGQRVTAGETILGEFIDDSKVNMA